jgi:hypothetical protein
MSISNFLRGFGFSKKNEEKEKLYQKEIDDLKKEIEELTRTDKMLKDFIIETQKNDLLVFEKISKGLESQKREEEIISKNFSKKFDERFLEKNKNKFPELQLSPLQQQLELDLKPREHVEEKKIRISTTVPISIYKKIMCNANHKKISIGNIITDAFKNIPQLGNIDDNPMIKHISNQQKAIDKKRSIMLEKGYLSTAAIDEVLGYPGATSKLCQNGLKHIRQENLIFVKREDYEKHMKKRAKKKEQSK